MPKLRKLQSNFAGGQVDETLELRPDTELYQKAAKDLTNCYLLVGGGTERRGGFRHVRASSISEDARGEPFVFSQGERYAVWLSAGRIDVILEPEGTACTVTGTPPWTGAQAWELGLAQAGDVMILVHPDIPQPMKLTRTGLTTFAFGNMEWEENTEGSNLAQPYFRFAAPGVYIKSNAQQGVATLTAETAPGVPADLWEASDVGNVWRLGYVVENRAADNLVERWYEFEITGFTSPSEVTVMLRRKLPTWADIKGTAASEAEFLRREYESMPWWTAAPADNAVIPTDTFEEPMCSPKRGGFRAVTFYNQRLVFAGHKSLPAQYCISRPGAYFNFDTMEGEDDAAIISAVGTGLGRTIRHVVGEHHLVWFADRGEGYIRESETRPLTPATASAKARDSFGAAMVKPVGFDGAIFYVQEGGTLVRSYRYDAIYERYESAPENIVSTEMVKGGVKQLAPLEGLPGAPEQLLVCLCGDGRLAVFFGNQNQNIKAWAPWETEGEIKSIVGFGDALYLHVKRMVDGVPTMFIEQYEPALTIDAAVTSELDPPTNVHGGFGHLAGQSVHVISDTLYLGEHVVAPDGTIALDAPYGRITAGLNYARRIVNLPPVWEDGSGIAAGRPMQLLRCRLRLRGAADVAVEGQRLWIRQVKDDPENPPQAVTGWREFTLTGWTRDGFVTIEQQLPLACTVLGFNLEVFA